MISKFKLIGASVISVLVVIKYFFVKGKKAGKKEKELQVLKNNNKKRNAIKKSYKINSTSDLHNRLRKNKF